MQIAIDFGISNTDAVLYKDGTLHHWTQPSQGEPSAQLVQSVLAQADIPLDAVERIAVTGGRSQSLPDQIGACPIIKVSEVQAIGCGGQALLGLDAAQRQKSLVVVSAGSGTAVVAGQHQQFKHVTGSAVGGATMLGLARLMLQTTDALEIDALALQGDPNGVDLSLADVISGPIGSLPAHATAVNFGRLAKQNITPSRADIAAGLVTLIGQVIAVIGINAAKSQQIDEIVLIGRIINLPSMRKVIHDVGGFYGVEFLLPDQTAHATALGALQVLQQS
jgi:type II pantothenate kinase